MMRARGNRPSRIIFQMVGKLSGTRLRSSRLKINETGRACLMASSSWPSDDGLRPSLVWLAFSENDDIADPRQSSAGPQTGGSDKDHEAREKKTSALWSLGI